MLKGKKSKKISKYLPSSKIYLTAISFSFSSFHHRHFLPIHHHHFVIISSIILHVHHHHRHFPSSSFHRHCLSIIVVRFMFIIIISRLFHHLHYHCHYRFYYFHSFITISCLNSTALLPFMKNDLLLIYYTCISCTPSTSPNPRSPPTKETKEHQ